jgi:hypothetical protein
MNHLTATRFLATAALALGALGAANAAWARSDVQFSIGVQLPGVYAAPAPIYVQPTPVYVDPQPVYSQPMYSMPVYSVPTQVYVAPARPAWGYYDNHGWRRDQWRRREWARQHEWEEHHGRDRNWD